MQSASKMFFCLHLVFLSVTLADSTVLSQNTKDCIRGTGVEYRGYRQSTSSGLTCLKWSNSTRDYDVRGHPDSQTGVGNHNYCRNPDLAERPWCYITGPDGTIQREFCNIETCSEQSTAAPDAEPPRPTDTSASTKSFPTVKMGSSQGGVADVQKVMGVSQRVHTGPQKKKDLGILGYALAILMMVIIIALGAGITLGYFYKKGQDLKKQHEQRVYEREMQRINLPLSAFSNPTCELVDESTIVITAEQELTPVNDDTDGGDPLIGQTGTPGA